METRSRGEKVREVRRRHKVKHRKRQGISQGKVEKTKKQKSKGYVKERQKKGKEKKESTQDAKRVAKKKGMLDKEKAKDQERKKKGKGKITKKQ